MSNLTREYLDKLDIGELRRLVRVSMAAHQADGSAARASTRVLTRGFCTRYLLNISRVYNGR